MLKNFSLALVAIAVSAGWALAGDEAALGDLDLAKITSADNQVVEASLEVDANGLSVQAQAEQDQVVEAARRSTVYYTPYYSPWVYPTVYSPYYTYYYQPVVYYRPAVYSYGYSPYYTSYPVSYWSAY